MAGIVGSFRPLTHQERKSFTVTRLKIVAAENKEIIDHFSKRTGCAWGAKMIAVVNGVSSNEKLSEGQLDKVAIEQTYHGQ